MIILWKKKMRSLFLILLFIASGHSERLLLLSKTHTASLQSYNSYVDVNINHFQMPKNTRFASFKFMAYEQDLSIYGCSVRNVSIHLKHGSPAVVNPDGSKIPSEFKNISRPEIYSLQFFTNKTEVFINITSPNPGVYYSVSYLSYTDPRYRPISQQGLMKSCDAYIESLLYIEEAEFPIVVSENQLVDVILNDTYARSFIFYSADNVDHCVIYVNTPTCSTLLSCKILIALQAEKPPSDKDYLLRREINNKTTLLLWTWPDSWHYLYISSVDKESIQTTTSFKIRCFSNQYSTNELDGTVNNLNSSHRLYRRNNLAEIEPYKQYNLIRDSSSESFTFSLSLEQEIEKKRVIPINITNAYFSVLKFNLLGGHDLGGTLQFILAYKLPQFSKDKNNKEMTIVGCIQRNYIAIPTWPDSCISNGNKLISNLVLNESTSNSTIAVPYPESGVWYASFKLFCETCESCNCSDTCIEKLQNCITQCETDCIGVNCVSCSLKCKQTIIALRECPHCDCDGSCKINSTNRCNTSIIFDISSTPCYYGSCGRNGRCIFMISDGTMYSSCVCTNNYRGFDCSDDTLATPNYLIVIEFLLLVLSNVFFLPSTYIAFKREYYVEALSYFSVFLFSSLYHMCDSGENVVTFCIVKLSTLQFADFFTALLAIWLTLLAIADLPPISSSVLQVGGSIMISFFVTLNKLSMWVFILPSFVGIIIIGLNWFLKYRKFRQRFLEKIYMRVMMPLGIVIVVLALIIFSLLQTQSNYKYLHSLWHILMAVGIMLLLPNRKTFQVEALL